MDCKSTEYFLNGSNTSTSLEASLHSAADKRSSTVLLSLRKCSSVSVKWRRLHRRLTYSEIEKNTEVIRYYKSKNPRHENLTISNVEFHLVSWSSFGKFSSCWIRSARYVGVRSFFDNARHFSSSDLYSSSLLILASITRGMPWAAQEMLWIKSVPISSNRSRRFCNRSA